MTGRYLFFSVALLVVLVSLGTIPAAGQVTSVSAETVCADVTVQGDEGDSTMVAVTPDDTQYTQGDTARLYPGTTVRVVLCGPDGPVPTGEGGWQFNDVSPFQNITDSEQYRTVVIETETVDLTDISGQDPDGELTVTVPDEMTHRSETVNESLLLTGESDSGAFATAETNFRANVSTAEEIAAALDENATAIASGDAELDEETVTELESQLEELNESHTAALASESALERQLFDQTMTHPHPEQSVAALERIDDRSTTMNESVATATANYSAAVSTVQSNARQSVALNLFVGLVVGLMLGGVAGAYLPHTRGKQKAYYSAHGAGEYDSTVVRLPLAAGVVLVLVGLGVFALSGLAGVFV